MNNKTIIPSLSIVVAVDEDGGFGKDGKIPWDIPEDLRHFKEVTSGGVCIMGRKTYEDMHAMFMDRKKPKIIDVDEEVETIENTVNIKQSAIPPDAILHGRQSFVVTSDAEYTPVGATAVQTIRGAIQQLDEQDNREIFVVGGHRMFIEALSWTTTIYLTIIKNERYQCDKKFPIEILNKEYRIVNGEETEKLYFVTYKKR